MLRTSSWPKEMSSGPCMNASSCARTHRENLPSSARVLASAELTTFSECMVTHFFKRENSLKLGKGHSRDSFQEIQRTDSNKPHSAPAKQVLVTSPAHLGALIAAKLRILDMIQDAATARLIPKQPLVARLDAIIGAATVVNLDALGDSEKPTARLYLP